MAYEDLVNIQVVSLGGINAKTGKKNPTELEGYYLGSEQRPNKFNPEKPKNFYKFQTASGDIGVYGSAGIDDALKSARIGLMTKLVSTGQVKDTGKGNPMKLFKAAQDKTNTLSVPLGQSEWDGADSDAYEEESSDEVVPTRPVAAVTATVPSTEKQARLNAMLNKHRGA
jgi:hypothetical protein